jgi:predicted  nucleic acid-binding Zn ribbon protein
MFLAKYTFYPDLRLIPVSEFIDQHCWPFVSALAQGGQFLAYGHFTSNRDRISYFAPCAERTSLSPRFHFARARLSYKGLLRRSRKQPRIELAGKMFDEKPCCTCRPKTDLVLTSNFLSITSPLKCTQCASYVPIYRFRSLTEDNLQGIDSWQETYDRFDGLFIGSGVGEHFSYNQLSSINSPLTGDGLKLCRALEQQLKVHVYYDLNIHYGRSLKAEKKRRCPRCNSNWLLKNRWVERFDFRCNKCRLVSNIAWDITPAAST